MTAPLEDRTYVPKHPPDKGCVPWVVEKWGPRSQLRWFRRFWHDLRPQRGDFWDRYFVDSVKHRGSCCSSCIADAEDGYDNGIDPDRCCCLAPMTGEEKQ